MVLSSLPFDSGVGYLQFFYLIYINNLSEKLPMLEVQKF